MAHCTPWSLVACFGFLLCSCGSADNPNRDASCPTGGPAPGDTVIDLEHDGIARQYKVHVPPSYDGKRRVPLVLNFHGLTSDMDQQELFTGMDAGSDERGFILVYPNGINNSWNAGSCCAFTDQSRDDVGFARAVVADVSSRLCIDKRRVYSTGMSNGGFMSHLLACKAADVFAAVGPVAGVLGIPAAECVPARPIPVIHFHGTADPLVPYNGGGIAPESVPDTLADWARRDGCTSGPTQVFNQGVARCETWSECRAQVEVTLCTIEGGGHCWPGQMLCPYPPSTTDIDANSAMLNVFERFALP